MEGSDYSNLPFGGDAFEPLEGVEGGCGEPARPLGGAEGEYIISPTRLMWLKYRRLIIAVVLVLLVVAVYKLYGPATVARKLAAAGWTLVAKAGCPACEKQLELFKYVMRLGLPMPAVVTCGVSGVTDDAVCGSVGAYPTWVGPGGKATAVGYQSLDDLKKLVA